MCRAQNIEPTSRTVLNVLICRFGFDLTSLAFRSQISVLFCHFSVFNTKRDNLQNVQVSMTEFRITRS